MWLVRIPMLAVSNLTDQLLKYDPPATRERLTDARKEAASRRYIKAEVAVCALPSTLLPKHFQSSRLTLPLF